MTPNTVGLLVGGLITLLGLLFVLDLVALWFHRTAMDLL